MVGALRRIVRQDGWLGLYRGLSPNVVGNSASWGLYFLWYTMIKEHMANSMEQAESGSIGGAGGPDVKKLSAGQHLLAASESGAITALMTNPIWVVKTRMFTTSKDGGPAATAAAAPPPTASQTDAATSSSRLGGNHPQTSPPRPATSTSPYRSLRSSLAHIYRNEGFRGLYKGTGLALFGVSNGAIQFMAYEQLKRYRSNVALKKRGGVVPASELGSEGQVKLVSSGWRSRRSVNPGPYRAFRLHAHTSFFFLFFFFALSPSGQTNTEYTIISGLAKLVAIGLTYPYQVVRSRIQNHATAHIYPTVSRCIQLTYTQEGLRAFYKGMSANLVRILPATCVTFVVYENVSWGLKTAAAKRSETASAANSD